MLDYQEMTTFLGTYLDRFKDLYYQSMAVRGLKEYIKSAGIGNSVDEWDYQSLPQTGIGRPKQADLILRVNGLLRALIELQVAYDRPYDARRLIYDLIKLESVIGDSQISRLLFIAGSAGAYRKHFMHDCQRGRVPNHLTLLPLKYGERKTFELPNSIPNARQLLSEYAEKLRIGIPQFISTRMVGEYTSPYICIGVWEVSRQNKRMLIPASFYRENIANNRISGLAII